MFKILVAGSDKRSVRIFEILNKKYKNCVFLLKNEQQLKEKYSVYLLPVPLSKDKIHVNNDNFKILISDFLKATNKESLILSAGFKADGVTDITDRDDFALKNAVPTAEGAILVAVNATEKTLADSNILVTGFGRVSKVLVHRLRAFCKNITVTARKSGDLALINALGYFSFPIDTLAEKLGQYDIIFNTVPQKIFNKDTLSAAKEGSVFIELASLESGFDTEFINSLPVTYLNAPGLPNKVAPLTAAEIMAETVINIINENYG